MGWMFWGEAGKYPRGITDVRDLLREFKALNPDVFLGGTYYADAVLFVRTAKELDFNPKAMVLHRRSEQSQICGRSGRGRQLRDGSHPVGVVDDVRRGLLRLSVELR